MDYEVSDSSGTDDDLPPSHRNKVPRGARVAGNGRSGLGSVPHPRMHTDMEAQIHNLEQDAYSSVLRAFKAQSDAITWEKEGLITELRKELRVSDDEHRELLARVNAEDIIRRIREWRQAGGHQPAMFSASQAVHDSIPSPTVSASRKKQKTSQSVPSVSLGVASAGLHPQSIAASMQPTSSAGKRGAAVGARGKMPKPGQPLSGLSSMKSMQYPSGPSGRGQFTNRGSSGALVANERTEAAAFDPLIGRKVMTRWPEDNNFYQAVITDYNPLEGRHALVYDINTANETWEWVDLKEITPGDIRWEGEDPGISRRGGRGGQGRGVKKFLNHDGVVPSAGRGRGSAKGQSRKEFLPSQNGIVKKVSDDIEILHTDTLIKEVERVFDASNPDLTEIEKAKKMLKEHEQALVDAIARLADASDGESDGEQPFSHRQPMDREQDWRSQHYDGQQRGTNFQPEMAGGRADGNQNTSDNQQDEDIDDI
ncbi:hypothetical protein L1049_008309 [Liquidambar formosana]|uniref:ENT domain-containing protein n=1 Tax=Liquidambar formosana TaxID=63359 RepID=A0AAP0X515_LIQFO